MPRKRARPVRRGAVGKGPAQLAPHRRPTLRHVRICEGRGVKFPPATRHPRPPRTTPILNGPAADVTPEPPRIGPSHTIRLIPVLVPGAGETDPSDTFATPRVAASALFFDEQGDRAPPPTALRLMETPNLRPPHDRREALAP